MVSLLSASEAQWQAWAQEIDRYTHRLWLKHELAEVDRELLALESGLEPIVIEHLLAAQFSRVEYDLYLHTHHWAEIRCVSLQGAGWICNRCREEATQVYHIAEKGAYRLLFGETPEVLEVLCRACHEAEHQGKRGFGPIGDILRMIIF